MSERSQPRPPSDPGDGVGRAALRGDTIVAIATAAGRGAVAMVRVSGPQAETICRRVCESWPSQARLATRTLVHECDTPAATLDDGLITWFPAPHSFTGETVVELGTHGGTVVPSAICAALIAAGARAALPGEFTERAVLNGKIDLLRAEAIADLIDSRSRAAHRVAVHQLSGALSRALAALREELIALDALLAYDIDFPSEDDGPLPRERILAACEALRIRLEQLLATAPAAILGRDGALVVLAGPPNAGKSSLLNALVGESRVIVSDEPGTTRDAVEVVLDLDPWPLRLVDTAGMRSSSNTIEQLGVAVGERYLAAAHVVIACADSAGAMHDAVAAIRTRTGAPVVCALTKCDLVSISYEKDDSPGTLVRVSAVAGTGLQRLLQCVTDALRTAVTVPEADAPMITRARHRTALEGALSELTAFRTAWADSTLPAPVAAVHVRAAVTALDELVGAVDTDEVFARVFATFCVGK